MLFFKIFGEPAPMQEYSTLGLMLTVSIAFSIYYGIKGIKSWVILTIILFSYGSILTSIIDVLGHYDDVVENLVIKSIAFMRMLFDLFAIYIFSKVETRKYFNDSGVSFIT